MKNDKMKMKYRVNEQIRVREVRVVSDNGAEVMPTRKALDLAHQEGVDLVEISPNAQPPVCRIIDYSKFLYQQKKHQKEMKQKQVKQEVKEIRFGPQTDEHDYNFKLKHARNSLMLAIRFVHTYSSAVVLSSSKNREKYYYFVLPTTSKSLLRLNNYQSLKGKRCSSILHQRRLALQRKVSRSVIERRLRLAQK